MRRLFLFLALLWSAPSWAAAPTVTSTYNGSGTSGATSTISNVACSGSNTLLVVFAGSLSENVPTGITKGSSSLTKLTEGDFGGVDFGSIWYLKAASNSSETVTATWGTSPASGAAASAFCLSDVDQTTTFGTPALGTDSRTNVDALPVSGSAADDLIIALVSFQSGGGKTISADVGTTKQTDINPLGGWTIVSGTHASGTSQSPAWTMSASDSWLHIVVNVLGTGGGGGGGPNTQFFKRRIQ